MSKQKLIGFNLLPETFTMKDVQELYETVYDLPFKINNFKNKILIFNVLERFEKKVMGTASRAPYLYRLRREGGIVQQLAAQLKSSSYHFLSSSIPTSYQSRSD